ncbi:MAG: Motility protein B [Firmicutes bacterium ADurb.Bin419]|nr:MAG: Motility protein B [Firmicutes bacterium ADurb.Bin419]
MGKVNRRSLPEDEPSEGAPEWMTTYSDLVTLLLTFFVLLFSMASVDSQKFKEVAYSLRSAFLKTSNGEMFYNNNGKDLINIFEANVTDDSDTNEVNDKENGGSNAGQDTLSEFSEDVEELIKELEIEDYVQVVETKTSVILRINSVILFDIGKADIKDSGKEALKKVGELMKKLNTGIAVQGHTDNVPIKTTLFPTNWELSTKRATNVVLFLVNECSLDPTKLTATGNGEFRPIAPNDTEENRQKNRRIDIVINK